MRRSLALLAVLAWAAAAPAADPPPDLAARAWEITETVLARHVEPPARQQMLLAGIKALCKAGRAPAPPGLARRVSGVEAPEQLAAILAETWPRLMIAPEGVPLAEQMLDGMLSAVPGGAERLSAREQMVAEQMEANLYVGIQVALTTEDGSGRPAFARVLEGGPAEQAGAHEGDRVEAVDGVSTEGMPIHQVVDRIRGEEGTTVLIRLRKKGAAEAVDVPMKRARLPRKTIQGRGEARLEGPTPIGYLKFQEIAGSTPQELRGFAARLESEGARAVVLDLREVSQAGFHPTILLADALLDGGTIGRVREADSERVIRAEPDALFREWPMVVLAGGSTSAEVGWLCAALEDNHRAIIVGRPVVGPGGGVVRSAVPLPGGEWSIKMATGRLIRGDGRPLVAPDRRANQRARMPGGEPAGGVEIDADVVPLDYNALPPTRVRGPVPAGPRGYTPAAGEDPLARARAILEAALKAAGP